MFHTRTIALLAGLATLSPCAFPETVTLQQGTGGYQDCVTMTLPGAETPRGAAAQPRTGEAMRLRGTTNSLLLKFPLPASLAGKKLARARLEVFVPAAKDLRMICPIACRAVLDDWTTAADWHNAAPGRTWSEPGGADLKTDYQRGRAAGVVDSYALWEYDGQYFPHRYDLLALPAAGKWIDFNVTPLASKWLADAKANHGVSLSAMSLGDKRFPNRVEMDIPSETSADAAHRPRLVMELEPLPQPYLAGMTHTLAKYCDRSTRYRFWGPFEDTYELAMARNEFEGLQVLIYPLTEPLKDVRLEWTDLAGPGGAAIPKDDIRYYLQDVFQLHPNNKIKDWYFHGQNFDVPDPLVTARPVDLPLHMSTPFWFTVRTRPETKPGVYRGRIVVRPAGLPPRELTLTVKVWDYAIPEKWNFRTMGQTCWDYIRRAHGKITPELKRAYIDFLLDHRFNPTEQYADKLSPDAEDIAYCFRRGANTIYLSGNFRGDVKALRQRYDAVQQLGLIDSALVYIGDETNKWDEMRRRSDAIRLACPELMIMIGGSFPRKELDGVIDIFDPQIDRSTNQVYSLPADRMKPLIASSQGRGESFFWYVAAGPMLPCPNVQMEDPLIASRVLFWLTWKFGVTGFEYYCYNIWTHNLPDKQGRRWPDKPFYPRGWGETNGDGMLFYPGPEGPFSSVRFENIRDGIEDWESHYVLRDYAEALAAKAARDAALKTQAATLLERAKAVLAVSDEVCPMNFTGWTWRPQVLLKARRELGETIEAAAKLVTEPEMLAVRQARHQAETDRQRSMLKSRAAAAKQ